MNDALEIIGAKVSKKRGRSKDSVFEKKKSKKRKKKKKEQDFLIENQKKPSELKYKEKRIFDDVKIWDKKEFYPNLNDPLIKLECFKAIDDKENFSDVSILDEKINVISYSDEEYEIIEKFTNSNWTRKETDELFRLCKMFDLRFYVIHDRLTFTKTLEEIKNRYFKVSQAVLFLRSKGNMDNFMDHPIMKQCYEYNQEVNRKKKMEKFFSRSLDFDRREHYATKMQIIKSQEVKRVENSLRAKESQIRIEEATVKNDLKKYLLFERECQQRAFQNIPMIQTPPKLFPPI